MATEAQIAANRVNGLKGGVKTQEGKAISRMNARKHGIFALALTAEDAAQLRGIEEELAADLKPVGVMEEILVEKMALTFMRMRRCARMEAEHYRLREQYDAAYGRMQRDHVIVTMGHYDIRLTNQFLRLNHELEQRQKMRRSAECRLQSAECRMTATTTEETLDSRLRGNDDEEVKNEPNLAGVAQPSGHGTPAVPGPPPAVLSGLDSPRSEAKGCILRGGNDESQAGAPVPQETKNEPNLANADCRMPIAECNQKMQNEPNSAVGQAAR